MRCSPEDITSFLTFRYPITSHALFRDCWGMVATDWHPRFSCSDETFEGAMIRVRELLSESIQKLVQGKQVGFAVGGLDSSLLVALTRELCPDRELYTYSVGFDEANEFEYACVVADRYNTLYAEIRLDKADYMEGLRPLIRYKGAPLHPNELALAYAERAAVQDGCAIVLCGEGADDIFGGYGQNLRMHLNYDHGDYVAFLLQNYRYFSLEDRAALIRDEYLVDDVELLRPLLDDAPSDTRDKMFYFIQRVHTVGLHARGANAMRFNGLPLGFPYLALRLVHYVNSLPFDYKVHWKSPEDEQEAQEMYFRDVSEEKDIPKYILKKLAEQYLPRELVYRRKCAFPVPFDAWFHDTKSWPLDTTVFKTTDISGLSGWEKFMIINLNTFLEEFKSQ